MGQDAPESLAWGKGAEGDCPACRSPLAWHTAPPARELRIGGRVVQYRCDVLEPPRYAHPDVMFRGNA